MAGARARARDRRRLQHADVAESAKPASPSRSIATGISSTSTPSAGAPGSTENRRDIASCCGQLWSPNWKFDEATFEATARSFDNPDFVDVVIHSYRVRYGYAPGDPALDAIEQKLAAQPPIAVPTIVLHGEAAGTAPPEASRGARDVFHRALSAPHVPRVGHNMPQDAPRETARSGTGTGGTGVKSPTVASRHFTNGSSAPLPFESSSTNRKEVIQCLIVIRRSRQAGSMPSGARCSKTTYGFSSLAGYRLGNVGSSERVAPLLFGRRVPLGARRGHAADGLRCPDV